jgi:allantoicase
MPGLARNMSEGWETRRRRGPGYDWAVVKLAGRGFIDSVEIDTSHFKGNYPDSCTLEGCDRGTGLALATSPDWHEILGPVKLQPHTRHVFADDLSNRNPITHVRLNIFPDGGVSRLRIYGKLIARVE